eukprot:1601688-Pyramimonas_sp.AAC.1
MVTPPRGQNGPKGLQDCPKGSGDSLGTQDVARWAQGGPRCCQDGHRPTKGPFKGSHEAQINDLPKSL